MIYTIIEMPGGVTAVIIGMGMKRSSNFYGILLYKNSSQTWAVKTESWEGPGFICRISN
jgi:hypothetical protein